MSREENDILKERIKNDYLSLCKLIGTRKAKKLFQKHGIAEDGSNYPFTHFTFIILVVKARRIVKGNAKIIFTVVIISIILVALYLYNELSY